jgi:CHASE2 domain-containing sensor protein
MPNVFLSYRRRESSGYSRHLHERLGRELGAGNVFMDVAEIAPGTDWRATLRARIDAADAILVLIGREWLGLSDPATGERRLTDPDDVTRFEIAEALRRGKRVIPVLLEGAPPPARDALPADIGRLADLQAQRLDHESFESDLQALLEHLTGRRVRDELERERGLRRLLSWAPPAVFAAAVASVALAVWGVLDLVALETRIETQTLAAASLVREPPIADSLALVAVDGGREPPGPGFRAQYAKLVDVLASDGATTIVIDIRFQQPNDADAALAAAFAAARSKGVAVHFAFNALRGGEPLAVPGLAAAATSVGFACVGKRLGVANAVPIVARRDRRLWPALALATAAPGAAIDAFDADALRLAVRREGGPPAWFPLSYVETARMPQTGCTLVAQGTERGYVLIEVPAAEAMRGAGRRFTLDAVLAGRLPRGTFERKTVMVGVETDDESFRVARGLGTELRFGYELHAIAASALATGTVPRKLDLDSQGWVFLLAAGFGAAAGYATHRLGRAPAAAILLAIATAYFATTVLVFARSGVLLNTGYDLVSFLCMFGLLRSLSRRWLPWDSRPRPAAPA